MRSDEPKMAAVTGGLYLYTRATASWRNVGPLHE